MTKKFRDETYKILKERVSTGMEEITSQLGVKLNKEEWERSVNIATGMIYGMLIQEIKNRLELVFDGMRKQIGRVS